MEKQGESNSFQDCPLRIIYGNDLNQLAQKLAEEFFSPNSRPFESRLIIVPHIFLKEYLFHRFLSDPRLALVAGVQVLPLNQAILEIQGNSAMSQVRKKIPSFLELSLSIEEKLYSVSMEKFPELLEYIGSKGTENNVNRISMLSDQLARLFARYGLYGQKFLPEWLSSEGWQQTLWREIFSINSPWTYPLAVLQLNEKECFHGKIALFGFSHLSMAHLSFFNSLGASIYQISPCAFFWGDHASDKERLFVQRGLRRKGVKENVQDEIARYMQEHHPLLGNWGKLGRELLKSLDAFTLDEIEVYCEPQGNNLLSQLKRCLLLLDETSPLELDDSLRLYSATSKLREVEILRDTLETLLQKHSDLKDPILPREILVVSPDISAYAPYIRMVFSQSSFAIAIEGMPLSSMSESVQGFLQWLCLPEQRFALPSMEKLLQNAPFMQKQGFSSDEVHRLGKWFKDAHILSGLTDHQNSWEQGLTRLLHGLALIPNEDSDFASWPLASVPHSEIDLFDRFLKLFSEMKSDFSIFANEMHPSQWFEFFLRIADKYFAIEWEREPFFQELKALAISCRSLQEMRWNFISISRVIQHLAQKPTAEIASSHLQKITFAPLLSGNLIGVRILCCLGMDEGSFPRTDAHSSLCEMSKASDYYPSKTDEDRASFLDMFVKAQDYLIFSYLRIHPEDGKQQEPSLLVEELEQYLRLRGLSQGIMKVEHPALPFDQSYFCEDAQVKKWGQTDYLAAKAYYAASNETIPFFPKTSLTANPQEIYIDIRQLKKLARNPLQFYFNEKLKIYLEEEDDAEEAEFIISHLRKSILRKKALQSNLPHVMRRLRAKGDLPQGVFQQAAIYELEEEMQDLLKELNAFGVRSEDIRSLHLSTACQESEKNEKRLPPLVIPLKGSRVAYITGSLEDICPQGLLYHGDNDLKALIRAWPLYLIYLCLHPENKPLLLTKKGVTVEFTITDPKETLAAYLEYYLQAKQTPSPLMPEWAKACLEGTAKDLKLTMSKDSEDIYLNYLRRRNGLFDPFESFVFWDQRFQSTFYHLLNK